MALLQDILYKVNITSTSGNMQIPITGISFHSGKIQKGNLFVAIKGVRHDGHVFLDRVIENGAVAVVVEKIPLSFDPLITYIIVKDSAKALGLIAANYYDNPSEKLRLVGVTGTNGKTTVATLLYRLYMDQGHNVGLISTIHNRIIDEIQPATHTTPDPMQLNQLLAKMVQANCTHCFIEVSSHAIVQERIAGLKFEGAIFTNLSHDHLDYHKSFQQYILAKKKFFDDLPSDAFALVNIDDRRGMVMLQNTKASKKTFSVHKIADFKAKLISNTFEGLEMAIDYQNIWFRLIGAFNAYNLLAVYAAAILLGEESKNTLKILSSLQGIPGRIEPVRFGSKFVVIIDYSHTPDALKNVLEAITQFKHPKGQIISVVGCGGNRDPLKRPLMTSVACKYSDKVILTNDNPRDEAPLDIVRDMQKGISVTKKKRTLVVLDREEAIKTACMMANQNDMVLISGKGHETYQEIKGVKYPFNDKEIVERMAKMFA